MKNKHIKDEMLKMDLKHEKNAYLTDIDFEEGVAEQEYLYRQKKLTIEQVIDEINNYSKDLPNDQKRCILCKDVLHPKRHLMKWCRCNFFGYDHDFDFPEKSRYLIDYDRIKHPDTIEEDNDFKLPM